MGEVAEPLERASSRSSPKGVDGLTLNLGEPLRFSLGPHRDLKRPWWRYFGDNRIVGAGLNPLAEERLFIPETKPENRRQLL